MALAAFTTQPPEASKAVDRQQGEGANPEQERCQRAEIAIEPKRTSYMHDAPLYQPNPPFPTESGEGSLCCAVAEIGSKRGRKRLRLAQAGLGSEPEIAYDRCGPGLHPASAG